MPKLKAKFCRECGKHLASPPSYRQLSKQKDKVAQVSPRVSQLGAISCTPPHLIPRILVEKAALEGRIIPDGERKTITALFADPQGSMELMEDLAPEDARSIMDPALKLMIDAVHCYEGYLAQSLSDGIFALFGAPIAHEDHPQRALYAALRMQEEGKRYAEKLRLEKGILLQIRVGINPVKVLVRSSCKDDLVIQGD